MALSKETRDGMPDDQFAVPGKRKLPLHDDTHVKLAWDMIDRTHGLTPDERAEARSRTLKRAHELGIPTTGWHLTASLSFEAMAVVMPDLPDHPNRHPFTGVLTFVDRPSDNPVGGAKGKRTIIPKAVAEAALESLLGMAVDFKPDFDGHDKTSKIGLITEANLVGDEVQIAGFFYAADFPKECARIVAEKDALGFSYECQARIQSPDADPWVVESCVFTGAAVLYKDRAAYIETSLAASAAEFEDMTPEQLKALTDGMAAQTAAVSTLTAGLTTLTAKVAGMEAKIEAGNATHDKVKPLADGLRACAASMEAAGVGLHKDRGHVKILHQMADNMEAESVVGKVPHAYSDHSFYASAEPDPAMKAQTEELAKTKTDLAAANDKLATMTTQVADLTAAATRAAAAPERKTAPGVGAVSAVTPEETKAALSQYGLEAGTDGKTTIEAVNKALAAKGITGERAIEAKLKLRAAGAFA